MFGNNNGKDNSKSNGSGSGGNSSGNSGGGGGVNTIDKNTTIEGNLKAGGDLRIDGTLVGDLDCQAKLIIGKSGHVKGTVKCLNAVIEGSFSGDLLVREKLDLMSSSKVEGDIRTKKMMAETGCEIKGTCLVSGSADPASDSVASGKKGNPLKQRESVKA